MSDGMISVVLPVHNAEDYIENCIKSLQAQTYSNIEIIIIDDGSTDSSWDRTVSFAKYDKRIICTHTENQGVYAARNLALDMANGDYIAFIDSDDFAKDNWLETMYKMLNGSEANIACCGFEWVDEAGDSSKYSYDNSYEFLGGNVDKRDFMKEAYRKYSYYSILWNKLYSKNVFESLRFPTKYKASGDSYLLRELIWNTRYIKCTREKLYYYVQRNGSITGKVKDTMVDCDINAVLHHLDFYNLSGDLELRDYAAKFICDRVIHYYSGYRDYLSSETLNWLKDVLRSVSSQIWLSKNIKTKRKCKYFVCSYIL